MNVLIAVASRHHATAEIGERIGAVLTARGLEVDLVDAEPSRWLDDEHAAYVIGSAVYLDRWLRSARQFLRANESVLAHHPVWFFSSGPLGGEDERLLEGLGPPVGAAPSVVPLEHRVFPGRLDVSELGVGERIVARAVGAPAGDFRDWDDIEEWAHEIADVVLSEHPNDTTGIANLEESTS